MRVVFNWMGYVGIKEYRAYPLPGEVIRDGVHGWRCHPVIWSGEVAEFDEYECVL
jgi:hypothetical protein